MKRKILLTVVVVLISVSFYIWHIISSTGYFREIHSDPVKAETHYRIPGAEDMEVDYRDGLIIVSSDDRANRRDGYEYKSGLYYFRPNVEGVQMRRMKLPEESPELFPHGISMYKLDSSSYRLLVVNHIPEENDALAARKHTKHSIVEFRLEKGKLEFIKDHQNELIQSPNDVVAVDETSFYFTNDHGSDTQLGKLVEDYLGLPKGNVVYYNGENYRKVASGIAYANGINYDPNRELLYVASPRTFRVLVYYVDKSTGDLIKKSVIDCGTGVDNIEIDTTGKLWIGAHPNLLAFAAYADGKNDVAPSEVITIDYMQDGSQDVRSVYLDEGYYSSASTTAIPLGEYVYIGNVMAESFQAIHINDLQDRQVNQ